MHTQSTFADILSARRTISPYVSRTPLRHYPSLSDALGAEVYLKHENYQVTRGLQGQGRDQSRFPALRRGQGSGHHLRPRPETTANR